MSTVAIKKCSTYHLGQVQAAIEESIKLLGGWKKFVKAGDQVLLKPNLIGPRSPEKAATTHPEVVRALIRSLKAEGCTVSVGDSAGGAIAGVAPTAQALRVAGYAKVCEEEGASLLNFDREGTVSKPSKTGLVGNEFHLAKPLFDADVVINLPKLKTHSAGVYTGAVKNTFGCIPGLRKAEYHRKAPNLEEFSQVIADIHLACNVTLNIMDAVVGMEGAGPTNGSPKEVGLIMASADSLALDTVASQIMGIIPQELDMLQAAAKLGVGEGDPKQISLVGDFTKLPLVKFSLPATAKRFRRAPRWILPAVINFLKAQIEVDKNLCRKCNICRESCPVGAISPEIEIDRTTCIECLCCQELCPQGAVFLKRTNVLARHLIPSAKSR